MTITKTIFIDSREQKIMAILGLAIFVLAGFYLYFINSGVASITARKVAEEKINSLSSEVATLEANYMQLSNEKVSLAYAYTLGFKDVAGSDVAYLVKSDTPVNLSLR